MAALLLKTHALSHVEKPKPDAARAADAGRSTAFFRLFNRGFEWLSNFYGRATARLIAWTTIVLVIYAGLLVLTGNILVRTPTGLVPQLDRSYLIAAMQLPPARPSNAPTRLVSRPRT
jgi:HAE1 family hydrophobic/amphiphilic exporter-1